MKLGFLNSDKIQGKRFLVQILFLLICIWIGYEFHIFINDLQNTINDSELYRPPGVEGFLPISSLMNLTYWFYTGVIHPYHPAGLFIFLGIIAISLVFGKSFCSWVCPVGFISEMVGDFGDKISSKIFKNRIKLPKYLDYPLRSVKYLLLFFFVNVIFFTMNEMALKIFLDGDYNLMSDVKMYFFFKNISPFSLTVISLLFILSIIFRNFWCRYLCPYGALLGFIGLFSPTKIKRNIPTCIDCEKCTKICPSFIKVHKVKNVISDECVSCYQCVDACPVENTLNISIIGAEYSVKRKLIPILILCLYFLFISLGMVTGNWQNDVKPEKYKQLINKIESLVHPTSSSQFKKLNK